MLNGAPRSGKSSICRALQEHAPGGWINLGVDSSERSLPERYRPGIGLRPGGERPDLEKVVVALYGALYESVATYARLGFDVVVDVGHHDEYSTVRDVLGRCARRLKGLDVLFVGVRCPLDVVWRRRERTWGQNRATAEDELVRAVARWQDAVHARRELRHGGRHVHADRGAERGPHPRPPRRRTARPRLRASRRWTVPGLIRSSSRVPRADWRHGPRSRRELDAA